MKMERYFAFEMVTTCRHEDAKPHFAMIRNGTVLYHIVIPGYNGRRHNAASTLEGVPPAPRLRTSNSRGQRLGQSSRIISDPATFTNSTIELITLYT